MSNIELDLEKKRLGSSRAMSTGLDNSGHALTKWIMLTSKLDFVFIKSEV